jgi:succinate dehydrogenase/fumarate reductase flavoprotein subunit
MAGLVAAARATELGAHAVVLEKLDRAGGSMRLSSGVVWRHRDLDDFRRDCPEGDERLQRLVYERLDEGLRWLESIGAPVQERDTGNPLTTGMRFSPGGLSAALFEAAGEVRFGEPLRRPPRGGPPLVLATGGFQANRELLRRHVTLYAEELLLRAAPGSTGDGLRIGLEMGADTTIGMDQFYGRNMPAPPARVREQDFVRLGQLYARHAEVTSVEGERYEARSWSEVDVAQWTACQPGARAWFRVGDDDLGVRVRGRTVGDMVEAAASAGAPVRREPGAVAVETVAGVTATLGGLKVDERAQAAPGVFACGGDAGGISTGGWSSGLGAALVLGRVAAESALGV